MRQNHIVVAYVLHGNTQFVVFNLYRPNGRLDTIVEVPDEPMPWMMSAFGISRELGFGFLANPAVVSIPHNSHGTVHVLPFEK